MCLQALLFQNIKHLENVIKYSYFSGVLPFISLPKIIYLVPYEVSKVS